MEPCDWAAYCDPYQAVWVNFPWAASDPRGRGAAHATRWRDKGWGGNVPVNAPDKDDNRAQWAEIHARSLRQAQVMCLRKRHRLLAVARARANHEHRTGAFRARAANPAAR